MSVTDWQKRFVCPACRMVVGYFDGRPPIDGWPKFRAATGRRSCTCYRVPG